MNPPTGDRVCAHRNIGIRITFDGSKYGGWQSQPNAHTVEDVLRSAINRLEGRAVKLTGASRTDSGVHATGQYANFYSTHTNIPIRKYALALNRYLPPSITIVSSHEHPMSFHARYSAKKRTYIYTLLISPTTPTAPAPTPTAHRSACYYAIQRRIPPLTQCNRTLATLCGTHDFCCFAKIDRNQRRSTVRTVYDAAIYPYGRFVRIKISANAFLRTMVRSIVGTILDESRCNPAYVKNMIYTGNRKLCGQVAPAHGLCLNWVAYE